MARPTLSRSAARRALLTGAGLWPGAVPAPRSVLAWVEALGFVQVDSITAVERAHHLILWSRDPRYDREALRRALEDDRTLWEHWTHDAAILPTSVFPQWRHRFDAHRERTRRSAWWSRTLGPEADLWLGRVRDRIRDEGPLRTQDFEAPPGHDRGAGWWNWTPAKAALEHLWRVGELVVARRQAFQKVYDLSERHLPAACAADAPTREEHVRWACETALKRLGVARPMEIAAFWDLIGKDDVRRWCGEGERSGEIVAVTLEDGGSGHAYAFAEALPTLGTLGGEVVDDAGPIRLLAPFDPVVRDRARALRLFDFHFRFEAFVPQAKRTHGYYVLPMLQGERFVGRVDVRTDRSRNRLVLSGCWWEEGVRVTRTRQRALDRALDGLAAFVGVAAVDRVANGRL